MRSNLLEPMEKSRFFQLVGDFEGLPSILLNINFRVGAKVRHSSAEERGRAIVISKYMMCYL